MTTKSQRLEIHLSREGREDAFTSTGPPPSEPPPGPGVGSGHKGAQAGVRSTPHTWWVRGGHLHSQEATKGGHRHPAAGHSGVRSRTTWAM